MSSVTRRWHLLALAFLAVLRIPEAAAAQATVGDSAVKAFVQDYLRSKGFADDPATRYSSATVLLNEKTRVEFVYLLGSGWCGSGGCSGMLLGREHGSFKVLQRFSLVQLPIRVLPHRTRGWHDMAMWVRGGGASPHVAVLRHDGARYPGNPSLAPALRSRHLFDRGREIPLQEEGEALYP